MNAVHLTGRLTADPDTRALPSGDSVCKLRLAVDRMGRGQQVGYVNVTVFGPGGVAAAKTLSKGWKVAVDGRLEYGEWQTDAGDKRSSIEVIGNVEFLAAPRTDGEQAPAQEEANATA